jgi:hypothetical protein
MEINNKELKKDIRSTLTNEEIIKKYRFDSNRHFIDYAQKNNLLKKPKKMTKTEEKNLIELSKFINKIVKNL